MINFSIFFNLKKRYYILNETNIGVIFGGVKVGKVYHGPGSGKMLKKEKFFLVQ